MAVERFGLALQAVEARQWPRAGALAEDVIRLAPNIAGPYYVAGIAALQLGHVDHAVARLSRASALAPARGDYAAQYARALAVQGDLPRAVEAARRALSDRTLDAGALDTAGIVLGRAALHGEAAAAFERATAAGPGDANLHYNLATSLLFHGDLDGAERHYETCLRLDPAHWRADLSISQLRVQTPGSNHVDRLRRRLRQHDADPEARLHLNLALAKELEDLDDIQGAHAHYTAGKATLGHRAAPLVDLARRTVDALVARPPSRSPAQPAGTSEPAPIFIVGMPRSGTTLVDRILSSHPDVFPAGELDNFALQLRRFAGVPTRTLLETATALQPGFSGWRALGEAYVESTRPATGHAPRFTDKHPLNFLFVGDILQALPGARVVCVRRNPMDTCLSNFRQLFAADATDYDYAYDLLETGRYYLLFDRLVRHWCSLWPERIVEVDYETLVAEPEPSMRRLFAACDLAWDPACLAFERNPAVVPSASAAQVRSPLNRNSVDRWRRYGARLDPLRKLLEDGGACIQPASGNRAGAA